MDMAEKCIAQLPHVRVPDSLLAAVALIAEREGRSVSWIVRTAVEGWVAQYTARMMPAAVSSGKPSCASQCGADKSQGDAGEV